MAACLATVLGPAVIAHATSAKVTPPAAAASSTAQLVEASAEMPIPAPGDRATWQKAAQTAADTCPGLPTAVLLAIAQLESSLGLQTFESSAGARGPMQFLPSTWTAYGIDGNGDGQADIMNATDALHGAAHMLCANGGAERAHLPSAIWHYNHSDDYVAQVLSMARTDGATSR